MANDRIWRIYVEYLPDDLDLQWGILGRMLEIEDAQGNHKGQSIVLGHMIANIFQRDGYVVGEAWDLVERKLEVDEKQGNLIGMIASLQNMILLHEEHGEWDPSFLWMLLERKLELELSAIDEGITQNPAKANATIWKMERWLRHQSSEDGDKYWSLIEQSINLETEEGDFLTEKKGRMLRKAARHWIEYGTVEARDIVLSDVIGILESGVGPLEVLENYTTLQLIGEEMPQKFIPNGEQDSAIDQIAAKWISLCARDKFDSVDSIAEIRDRDSYLLIHKIEGPGNIRVVSVSKDVPDFEITERGKHAVLDLPNITGDILRWGKEGERRGEEHYSTTAEGQKELMMKILEESRRRFDDVWFSCTPNLLRKFGHGIEALLRDDSAGLLLNNIDARTTNEDQAFISYAMATGSTIVSSDGFHKEALGSQRMGSFIRENSLGFKWWRGDFHIDVPLKFVTSSKGGLTEQEAGLTNLIMKIAYDYYEPSLYSAAVESFSVDFKKAEVIIGSRKTMHGYLIGKGGKKIKELEGYLKHKLGVKFGVTIAEESDDSE
jgi:hypothetical protein